MSPAFANLLASEDAIDILVIFRQMFVYLMSQNVRQLSEKSTRSCPPLQRKVLILEFENRDFNHLNTLSEL